MSDASRMNVLAVAAHPDDLEILCAGTLARYAAAGHAVTMAVFTSGNMGDARIGPTELARIRETETRAAAQLLGARLIWPGVDDEHVFPNETQRRLMIDLLRETDPDVIFTHSPEDYHPDHRNLSQLVFDSYFQKGLPHIPDQRLPACRFAQAEIYYLDTIGGVGFEPVEYVDITDTMELKRSMLRCHRSQFAAMSELASTDLLDLIEIVARFRGLAARCRYAEGFRRMTGWQRGLTRRILP
jgi:LmbE family N-acetylglucosaminyl deacetylase